MESSNIMIKMKNISFTKAIIKTDALIKLLLKGIKMLFLSLLTILPAEGLLEL